MIVLLTRIYGLGLTTAELLVREALARNLLDRRTVAR
jgi:hypothetical protein